MQKSNNNTLIILLVIIAIILWFAYSGGFKKNYHLPSVQVSSGSGGGAGGVQGYISQTFGVYSGEALTIATCESSLNPAAYNTTPVPDGEHAMGLFQIIPSTFARVSSGDVYNYIDNTNAAWKIFSGDGYSWREWECKP